MMFEYWDFVLNVKGGLMARKQEYTKESVSKALKEIGYLTQQEIEQHPDLPSHTTVLRLFKTLKITNVWKELSIPFTPRTTYTKEEVSKALKEIGYLKQKDINQHPDLPSRMTIVKLFKTTSMANVWKELSIPVRYTKEEISKALKKTGYLPQRKINQHPDLPSLSTVLKLFKTFKINNVWKELNIPSQNPSYTKEEVSKALKKTGYLTQKEIDQHPDLPSCMTVLNLFKTTSIANVWKELDIPSTPQPSYKKEEVSKALKEAGWLSYYDIDQHPDLPSRPTVLKLFKTTSINDVWKELDIPFPSNNTKEDVSKALKETGHLKQKEIDQHPDLPSVRTILRLFKTTSMTNVWKELNIDPQRKKVNP